MRPSGRLRPLLVPVIRLFHAQPLLQNRLQRFRIHVLRLREHSLQNGTFLDQPPGSCIALLLPVSRFRLLYAMFRLQEFLFFTICS